MSLTKTVLVSVVALYLGLVALGAILGPTKPKQTTQPSPPPPVSQEVQKAQIPQTTTPSGEIAGTSTQSAVAPSTPAAQQIQNPTPPPPPPPPPPTTTSPKTSENGYYINVDGNKIPSPTYSETVPSGATAKCRDGTYSFSQHRSGTCSHHGGVAQWL